MTEWLNGEVVRFGYAGIFVLLMIARAVPPVPAETVVPMAGLAAAHGELSLLGVALAGGLGSAAGELLWYLPSRRIGQDRLRRFLGRHGRWLTLEPPEVERALHWFERHGPVALFLSQPVPGLRTAIAIPAGALAIPVGSFLAYTGSGSFLHTIALAGAGYLLQTASPRIADYLGYAALAVFAAVLLVYAVRLVRRAPWRSHGRRGDPSSPLL